MQRTTLADLFIWVVPLGLEHGRRHRVASGGMATGLSHLSVALRRVHWNGSTTGEPQITRIRERPGKGTGGEMAVSPQRRRRWVGWSTVVELRCAHTHAGGRVLTTIWTRVSVKTRWHRWRVERLQTRWHGWRCTRRRHLARRCARRQRLAQRRTSSVSRRESGGVFRHREYDNVFPWTTFCSFYSPGPWCPASQTVASRVPLLQTCAPRPCQYQTSRQLECVKLQAIPPTRPRTHLKNFV